MARDEPPFGVDPRVRSRDGRRGPSRPRRRSSPGPHAARALGLLAAIGLVGQPDVALIDLRERTERAKHGSIPGAVHAPYPELQDNIRPGGMLYELASATGKRMLFYCAFGERSAMAVQAAQDAGLISACHIAGGLDAWKKAQGPVEH